MDLYIYYHAAQADAAAVQAAVARLQQGLRQAHGQRHAGAVLRCGLKRRPPAADAARDTWMEIYLDVRAPFPELLAAAVAESSLPRLTDGSRHVEIFVEALPCA